MTALKAALPKKPHHTMDLKATLFPYYIIFQDGLLLMNNTCEKAVFTMDKDIVLLYKNEFDIFKSQLSSIFTNTKDVETVIPYLLSLPDKTKTYYITYKPEYHILQPMN